MPLKEIKGVVGSGLTLQAVLLGEMCPKCKKARMLHPRLYVYTCPFCRFSYQINPVGRFDDITILNKGERK